jgi:hypothetical protein
MVNLSISAEFGQITAFTRHPEAAHKAKRAALRRPVRTSRRLESRSGQHIERMVALQQLEELRIGMTMQIRKLLKDIFNLE